MSASFQYKPRFMDMRVKPPRPDEEEAEADVLRLKPGEKPCQHPDCLKAATARAPKSRDQLNEFYDFCQAHAAEYNRSWNYYAGLSEDEIRARYEDEAMTGGRPTWQMKAGRFSREAAAFAAKFGSGRNGGTGRWSDPFAMFGQDHQGRAAEAPQGPRLGRLERQALADLDLEPGADRDAIRARYYELLKRCHPDHNGGDRSAEDKLQRVIKAFKTLTRAKMA